MNTRNQSINCLVRYKLNLEKLNEFKEYGKIWIDLINRLGGYHHGYFLPSEDRKAKGHGRFSFSGMGSEGPTDVGYAVFSFPDWETYERYRAEAGKHEECQRATEIVEKSKCFISYERNFMSPLFE